MKLKHTVSMVFVMFILAGAGYAYNTLVYTEQGGAKTVVASGGEIEIQSGGTLDVQSGATFSGDLAGVVTLTTVTNATIPTFSAATHNGTLYFCSDCGAGAPALVVGNGSTWALTNGTEISTE